MCIRDRLKPTSNKWVATVVVQAGLRRGIHFPEEMCMSLMEPQTLEETRIRIITRIITRIDPWTIPLTEEVPILVQRRMLKHLPIILTQIQEETSQIRAEETNLFKLLFLILQTILTHMEVWGEIQTSHNLWKYQQSITNLEETTSNIPTKETAMCLTEILVTGNREILEVEIVENFRKFQLELEE